MNTTLTKLTAAVAVFAMSVGLAACGESSADKGHVRYMNNKPEIVNQLKTLAASYTKQTGVQVDIQTAASGTYDTTMASEMSKSDAPTMFNISGYDQFAKYQRYAEPLQTSKAYSLLSKDGRAYAYKDGSNVYTLPYAAE
ncbi:ABC transporter substrate-binding protein [Bifidobacterium apri]|uniref:ABC transporter substrate-binding protein n=1 Tax=Bifidobacterium apri TaxID=1769423 RepID=A0A6A2VHN8_9BIFI|nr:ABC transporter substrate-binding protein [Bifidobacterium apri]